MKPVLVVGAGIAGVTAAVEAAEAGQDVVVVEREPAIGGRVLRNHQYFPKFCPPSCGMEINSRRIEANPRVRVLLRSQVTFAEKAAGGSSIRSGCRCSTWPATTSTPSASSSSRARS